MCCPPHHSTLQTSSWKSENRNPHLEIFENVIKKKNGFGFYPRVVFHLFQDCTLCNLFDLCRTPTPREGRNRPESPPFVDSLSYCGPMNTQFFGDLFVAFSSIKQVYDFSSTVLWKLLQSGHDLHQTVFSWKDQKATKQTLFIGRGHILISLIGTHDSK